LPDDPTLFYTYEALRQASQLTSPFCITELSETLTQPVVCNQFNNTSYIKDVMCQQVRQKYCTAEWRSLEQNRTIAKNMFDCNEYGEIAPVNCSKQFGLVYNDSFCLPLCDEFSEYGETFTTVYFILNIISHITNIIGGVAVLTASFLKRRKM